MARRLRNKKVVEYPVSFKLMVVKLTLLEGVQSKQICDSLDLHPLMVSRWRKLFRDGELRPDMPDKVLMTKKKKPPKPRAVKKNVELEQLKKENAKLKKENDFLKKWQRYLADLKQKDSLS